MEFNEGRLISNIESHIYRSKSSNGKEGRPSKEDEGKRGTMACVLPTTWRNRMEGDNAPRKVDGKHQHQLIGGERGLDAQKFDRGKSCGWSVAVSPLSACSRFTVASENLQGWSDDSSVQITRLLEYTPAQYTACSISGFCLVSLNGYC